MFPPDGLCTIMLFNSLYTTGGSTLLPLYKEDFQYFLETAKAAAKTEFGIGIDQTTCSDESKMKQIARSISVKKQLEVLWEQHHVYHYGQVNSLFRPVNKRISAQVKAAAVGLRVSSVERVSTKTPSWPSNITRALSIGMGGRWYEPCGSAAASKLGDKCGSACRKHKLKPSAQIVSIMEMCHAKANATRISYALAAQDIQFDDPSGDCGYGPYPRLHMMKKLSEFFAFNYTSSAQEKKCAQIA
ncbi:hypothetical protein HPB50_023813 [Hyalomma asiaticum]|uniref:Uncharacterized protein n=1 Tax=Hyalomma asiaticum TaxID=266040 RepID=A0ACB7SPI1_HYAAI|nr:hypothetical protein HPB50_023813 [Hyalomma asiaticum]